VGKTQKRINPDSPEFSALLENLKRIIRSSRQKGGEKLPHPLGRATAQAVIHQRSIRITDGDGNKVAVIPEHWIPLFERLESARFTHAELVALEHVLSEEESTTETRSAGITQWAKSLK
jgi:hypothetical protein